MRTLLITLILNTFLLANTPDTITFFAKDSLEITADLYLIEDDKAPFIILYHQAGWSRGAYKEIAPKLNEMGFNCLATDQRSGGKINGVENETFAQAKAKGKKTNYIDALADMQAALDYVQTTYKPKKLLIWGSSYSSALAFVISAQNKGKIDGQLSFSPGEYFTKQGKSATYIQTHAKKVDIPVFISSAKNETQYWMHLFNSLPGKENLSFIPKTEGQHGSRALWEKFEDHAAYWKAVTPFLNKFLPPKQK